MQLDLIVQRVSTNALAGADSQKKEIANSIKRRVVADGVIAKAYRMAGPYEVNDKGQIKKKYEFKLRLEKQGDGDAVLENINAARKIIEQAAEARGWGVLGEITEVRALEAANINRPEFKIPDLDLSVQQRYFEGLRERDAHLRLIWRSFRTYEETKGEERNHILLYGDAASAKSSVALGFKDWLDSLDGIERILHVNATTLSKAGLETLLLEKSTSGLMPEGLFVNELEKADSNDLLCLLSIMDGFGKISRLNARIGKREAKCAPIVIADCNDAQKVKNAQSGAIWSRFTKKLPCVRPSRETMTTILYEMIDKRKQKGYPANKAWVPEVIRYAFDVKKNNDPRYVKSLLEGGDDILTGKYFADLEAIEDAYKVAEAAKTLCSQV
jgi:hypothetical protein